jgi:hypothetical protein
MTAPPSGSRGSASAASHAPHWAAAALLLWLSLVVLGSGFAAAVLLSSAEDYVESTSFQVVLCMTGGALGASLTALLAAGERIARGWSFARDALARGERGFNARLAPLLAVQPILGAALGLLLLLALSAGAVMLLRVSEGTIFDPMGLLLVSVVAGLFARTLLARVRDAVEALFGRRGAPGGGEGEAWLSDGTPAVRPAPPTAVSAAEPSRDAPSVPSTSSGDSPRSAPAASPVSPVSPGEPSAHAPVR